MSEPTLASAVVDRLRGDILRGALPPGEKLRLEHLAPRYGVGRTPLREACCRLASEGLVTIEDQRGFRVAPISRADLLDLTRTRQHIETLALRGAIAQGDIAWEGEVTAALHRLQRRAPASAGGTLDEAWETEHARFHATLLSACGSPWLLKFHAMLFDQSERYRRLAQAYGRTGRDVGAEHTALVRATLERDAERACALLSEHIARTTELVLSSIEGLGGPVASSEVSPAKARRAPEGLAGGPAALTESATVKARRAPGSPTGTGGPAKPSEVVPVKARRSRKEAR